MNEERTPRSRFYDGRLYAWVMDSFLAGLHGYISNQVNPGEKVLDAGCGTGALVFRIAEKAKMVVGVDLSPEMVKYANSQLSKGKFEHLSFVLGDVSRALADHHDGFFDLATLVLALHEMPPETRTSILQELSRLAKRVLCVDFRSPMPWNVPGVRNRFFELSAGAEHFKMYRDFQRREGTPGTANIAGLACEHVRHLDAGTVDVYLIRRKG